MKLTLSRKTAARGGARPTSSSSSSSEGSASSRPSAKGGSRATVGTKKKTKPKAPRTQPGYKPTKKGPTSPKRKDPVLLTSAFSTHGGGGGHDTVFFPYPPSAQMRPRATTTTVYRGIADAAGGARGKKRAAVDALNENVDGNAGGAEAVSLLKVPRRPLSLRYKTYWMRNSVKQVFREAGFARCKEKDDGSWDVL